MVVNPDVDFTFCGRMNVAIERVGGAANLARRAGLSEGVIQKYKKGESDPSRLRLVAIAGAAGLSIRWLATGQGPETDTPESLPWQAYRKDILASALELLEEWLETNNRRMTPKKKAEAASMIYEMIVEDVEEGAPPLDRRRTAQILRLFAGQP